MNEFEVKNQQRSIDSTENYQPPAKTVCNQEKSPTTQLKHCNQSQACINLTLNILSFWKNLLKQEMKKREIVNEKVEQKQQEEQFISCKVDPPSTEISEEKDDAFLFCQKFKQVFVEVVMKKKEEHIILQKNQFKSYCTRQIVQQQVDRQIFREKTSKEEIIEYLQNPEIAIKRRYQKYQQKSWNSIKIQYQKDQDIQTIHQQFYIALESFQQFLAEKQTDATKQSLSNLFKKIGNQTGQSNELSHEKYSQIGKKIVFQYFIDVLTNENLEGMRQCENLKITPIYNLSNFSKKNHIRSSLKNALLKLRKDDQLKIANLSKFITQMLTPQIKIHLQKELEQITVLTQKDQAYYFDMITQNICPQKCPGCGRICELEGEHQEHKVVYGHQVRGLNGNFILGSKGEKYASIKTCRDTADSDIINYQEKEMTWGQFKDIWKTQPQSRWNFNATKGKQTCNMKNEKQVWSTAGPISCEYHGITYLDRDSQSQAIGDHKKQHFIFAVNNSGLKEQGGIPFNNMLERLNEFIQALKVKDNGKNNIKISIVEIVENRTILYENLTPFQIKIGITYKKGRANLNFGIKTAMHLVEKYIKQSQIIFCLMTCSQSCQPSVRMPELLKILSDYPHGLQYFGVEFGDKCKAIQQINETFKNITINPEEFLNSQQEIKHIETIRSKIKLIFNRLLQVKLIELFIILMCYFQFFIILVFALFCFYKFIKTTREKNTICFRTIKNIEVYTKY